MQGQLPSPCSMQIKLFLISTLLTVLNPFQLQQQRGPVRGKDGAKWQHRCCVYLDMLSRDQANFGPELRPQQQPRTTSF